jgi:hypothetical protein
MLRVRDWLQLPRARSQFGVAWSLAIALTVGVGLTPAMGQTQHAPEPPLHPLKARDKEDVYSRELYGFSVSPICSKVNNSFKCARLIEKAVLAAGHFGVSRDGARLAIRLDGGNEVVLMDAPDALERRALYSYQGYIAALASHLMHVQYEEGSQFMLVHARIGTQTLIDEVPVISPDGRRFSTATTDLDLGGPTRLQIWRIEPSGLTLEWTYKPPEALPRHSPVWGPLDAVWIAPDALRVSKVDDIDRPVGTIGVRLTPSGWQADDETAPSPPRP